MSATAAQWRAERDRRKTEGSRRPLTARETEVLICRCKQGLTLEETGHALGITCNTVRNHTTRILDVLGVRTMYEGCFRVALQLGRAEAFKAINQAEDR